MTRLQRLSPALLTALLAACSEAQPYMQPAAPVAAPLAFAAAGLGDRTASLSLQAAAAYALQQAAPTPTTVHRWVPADLVRYDVELRVRNATVATQFDAIGQGLNLSVPVGAQGTGQARFGQLSQGKLYRAYVKAMGRRAGSQDAIVQVNAQAQNDFVDFDFTAANDVAAQVDRSLTVKLDDVAFSGTGALGFGTPSPGVYVNPSEGPVAAVSGPPTPPPPAVVGSYPVANDPVGLAIDGQGQVWVAGQNSFALSKLNSSGSSLGLFQGGVYAAGIALDGQGRPWVTDNSGNKIQQRNPNGGLLQEVVVGFGPSGIAIDRNGGTIWVGLQGGSKVVRLNSSGSVLGSHATGTSPNALTVDGQGNLWAADEFGTVTKLSSSGAFLFSVALPQARQVAVDSQGHAWVTNGQALRKLDGATGSLLGSFSVGSHPFGVAVDAQDAVWVSDLDGGRVHRLSSSGSALATYTVGSSPRAIAIDPNSGAVWVLNRSSGTVTLIR